MRITNLVATKQAQIMYLELPGGGNFTKCKALMKIKWIDNKKKSPINLELKFQLSIDELDVK